MSEKDFFNECCDDVLNQQMSLHAFVMYVRGYVNSLNRVIEDDDIIKTSLQSEVKALRKIVQGYKNENSN